MPMQIGLEELLSMLVGRMDDITLDGENQKSKFNIMMRILYKKGLFNEADVIESLRAENKILLELGMIKNLPDENALKAAAENLLLWIKGDQAEIKKSIEKYQKQIEEAARQNNSPKIDVAPAGILNELDRLGGNNNNSGRKIIL